MRSREADLLYIFLAVDLMLLNTALVFVAWIDLDISLRNYHQLSNYLLHANLSWVVTYFAFTKKNLFLRDSFLNRVLRISKRQLIFVGIAASLALLLLPNSFSRFFFLEYSFLFWVAKIVLYWILYRYIRFKRSKQINTIQAAIVGLNDTGKMLRTIIDSNPNLGYHFAGFISTQNSNDKDLIGHTDKLEELIDKHQIQMVFFTLSFLNGLKSEIRGEQILKTCNRKGVRLRVIPKNQKWFRKKVNMESVGDFVVINPQEIPLDDAGLRLQKRFFDLIFSSLVIVLLLWWLLPLIALLIKINSKGPVFFIQKRTGINNKTFNCLKFRSMRVNDSANEQQATAYDQRITKIGRFMRKTNIDELPQFFNVFAGSMSVVGPRPHMLKHTEEYTKLIEYYLIRHYVKPGITGLAQVKGFRGETQHLSSMENRVKADMEYIENWSFLLDLKIIWKTVFGKDVWKNAG